MGSRIFVTFNVLLLILIPLPLLIVIVVSFSPAAYTQFPPSGFSLRWYESFLTTPKWVEAFATSAALAALSSVVATLSALLAVLATREMRTSYRQSVDALSLFPLIFPHAAIGVAFMTVLVTFQMNGTFTGLFLVHVVICLPFAYRPISVAMSKLDPSLLEAAMICGAQPAQAHRKVTLPLMKEGVLTALLFSFIFSFDEVTISMFLVSSEVSTLPVAIYAHIHDSADPIVAAISTLLIVITVVMVLALQWFAGLGAIVRGEAGQSSGSAGR